MNNNPLQQLRDKSKSHTDKASQLFQEAIKLFRLMQEASSFEEYAERRNEWLEKDTLAREEVRRSSETFNQFFDEVEHFKNNDLN